MEELVKQAGETLINLGFPGVMLMAAFYAIHRLFEQNQKIWGERSADGKEILNVVKENTEESRVLSDLIRQGRGH